MQTTPINKNALVEKRNILNELRSNNMGVQELRFFSIYLSKINARDISTKDVRFYLDDFRRIMDLGRINISTLKNTTNQLLGQIVHIPNPEGRDEEAFISFHLFDTCKVGKDETGKWYVEITAHEKALPLMFDFKDRYFTYKLWNVLNLKSVNQLRMYELLKQYEHIGKREMYITDLRELLGISPNKYTRWERFRTHILDSCQKALSEHTDICYTYEKGKSGQGGKWISIIFHIQKNPNYVDQLSLDEFIESDIIEADGEEIIKLESNENENDYENEHLAFLASACNNEFNNTEMLFIHSIIAEKDLPEHSLGEQFAQYHFLDKKYKELNYRATQTEIKNRFAYFVTLINA